MPSRIRNRSCRSFSCVTLKALISPGSTMKPREIAVFFEEPSPNQIRSFRKKPFGIPTRETRDGRADFFPVNRLATVSQAPMIEAIICLEQTDAAVGSAQVETIVL